MRRLLFFFCFVCILCCKTKKDVSENVPTECKIAASVKDFTGLDGCSFLIVLENGDKLLPTKLDDENFEFKDGRKIRFDYEELQGIMSICMAEKMVIEITCIKEIE